MSSLIREQDAGGSVQIPNASPSWSSAQIVIERPLIKKPAEQLNVQMLVALFSSEHETTPSTGFS